MSPYSQTSKEMLFLHHKLRKWLEQLSGRPLAGQPAGKNRWMPSADIYETPRAYHVFVDLSGVDPSSIELFIEGRSLRMSGERRRPQVEACVCVHQLEIDFGSFERCFQFPVNLDPEGSHSFAKQGFLEIILPKERTPASIRIPLQSE